MRRRKFSKWSACGPSGHASRYALGRLLADAVDKGVGATGLVALAAAGLSWVVLVFIAPPGLRAHTDARNATGCPCRKSNTNVVMMQPVKEVTGGVKFKLHSAGAYFFLSMSGSIRCGKGR